MIFVYRITCWIFWARAGAGAGTACVLFSTSAPAKKAAPAPRHFRWTLDLPRLRRQMMIKTFTWRQHVKLIFLCSNFIEKCFSHVSSMTYLVYNCLPNTHLWHRSLGYLPVLLDYVAVPVLAVLNTFLIIPLYKRYRTYLFNTGNKLDFVSSRSGSYPIFIFLCYTKI